MDGFLKGYLVGLVAGIAILPILAVVLALVGKANFEWSGHIIEKLHWLDSSEPNEK